MKTMTPYWKRRALYIKRTIVDPRYERECQAKSLMNIYRRYVMVEFPMGQATFWRYMHYAISVDGFVGIGGNRKEFDRSRYDREKKDDPAQLRLFDNE